MNTFMLRIGQDDLFQKAFPGVCPYPDLPRTPESYRRVMDELADAAGKAFE